MKEDRHRPNIHLMPPPPLLPPRSSPPLLAPHCSPGLQGMIHKLAELVNRIDSELHAHILECFTFHQFAFRWMNNLLMRELSLEASIRLWDT